MSRAGVNEFAFNTYLPSGRASMGTISKFIIFTAVCVPAVVCFAISFSESAADEPTHTYRLPRDNDHNVAAVTIVECIAKVEQHFLGQCRSKSDTIAILSMDVLIDLK